MNMRNDLGRTRVGGGPRLVEFLRESLMIEGIDREPTQTEIDETGRFVFWPSVNAGSVIRLVGAYQPNAVIRDKPNLNVRVGRYVAPRGGPGIVEALEGILADADSGRDPWVVHGAYETLHPFTDGNGRSGRALWARQMMQMHGGLPDISFLHWAYYQSLAHAPERAASPRPLPRTRVGENE